ncbi:unnamed protein product [Rotaria magnacalcarata]|uniref:Methyltransferase FkbM domain-containing protein n=3 Tax=Rotaria magnacalcarata TaxID=392030 RepID=A0A816UMG4_9BILA|nr:unnamed protein product [Rotaria magnacalcarata]
MVHCTLISIALALVFVVLWKDFFSFRTIILSGCDFYDHSESKSYNKQCGLNYWGRRKNFGNKDDIRFFPILNSILAPTKGTIVMIEFGANIGQFSETVLSTPHNIPFVVYSLEPVTALFNVLTNRTVMFEKQKGDKHFQYNIAISNHNGKAPIYSVKDTLTEGASLGKEPKFNFVKVGDVLVTTLPDFINEYHIKTPVSFIKIDVEGFEPEVIMGMNLKTNKDRFPLFCFETGGTWRDGRSVLAKTFTLKSFVAMLDGQGYDSFFIGYPYLLPINGGYWDDSFDDFTRASNILAALRHSNPWKSLFMKLRNVSLNSCRWQ